MLGRGDKAKSILKTTARPPWPILPLLAILVFQWKQYMNQRINQPPFKAWRSVISMKVFILQHCTSRPELCIHLKLLRTTTWWNLNKGQVNILSIYVLTSSWFWKQKNLWIKILYHKHIMWSLQQTPSPDDPSCQPFVVLPLATFLYYSLKESLYFYFALSTPGHTARLPIDHRDQLRSVYEFMQLNESGALIHWGQRDFSKFIVLCSFVCSPTSKKYKICFWRLNSRPLDDNLAAWEWEQFRDPT